MSKNRLRAMPVPWSIESAVSGLLVMTWENDETIVEANVVFEEGVDPGGQVNPKGERVVISFANGQYVRFEPASQSPDSLDRSRFDVSGMALHGVPTEPATAYLERYRELWLRNQRCPDPSFYEVADSDWLRETGATEYGCRHFVVEGHDAYVEVLATDWNWRYKVSAQTQTKKVSEKIED